MHEKRLDQWALLIGIDEYRHQPQWNLSGAVRDVEALAEHLCQHWGFRTEAIRKLTNAAASRAGIQASMSWLQSVAAHDDIVVVFYSGHGSWRYDASHRKRRADGREKTLVPHDSGRGSQANLDLGGDEIHAGLQKLARITPFLTVILDCCHSGTLTRSALNRRPRFVEPAPSTASEGFRDISSSVFRRLTRRDAKRWFALDGDYTLIAACRSDQSAFEIQVDEDSGIQHGVLTYFLLRQLQLIAVQSRDGHHKFSYQDLLDGVRQDLEQYFQALDPSVVVQEPQLEGARDREVFGRREIPVPPYTSILERFGAEVQLAGGAAHWVRFGSEFEVFPGGAKRALLPLGSSNPSPSSGASIGRLRVIHVQPLSSRAHVLSEVPTSPIRTGDRAVLSNDARDSLHVDFHLSVRVEASMHAPEEVEKLHLRIQASPFLQMAKPGGPSDVTVLMLSPSQDERPSHGLPALRRLDGPSWAVTHHQETLLGHLHPVGVQGSLDAVVRNLETRARWMATLRLQNPGSPLSHKIHLVLKHQKRPGEWVPAEENRAFRVDERFAFEIQNHYRAPVFVYVLDLGFGGGVDLLYPPMKGTWEPLKPNRAVEVGNRWGTCKFRKPAGYPYHPDLEGFRRHEDEVLKMIVTTEATDFRVFFQKGYRSPPGGEHRRTDLGNLLSLVRFGEIGSHPRDSELAESQWTTAEYPVRLRL